MIDTNELVKIEGHEKGFTLIEVLISILITLIVMGSVFGLLTRGQKSFQREPEIADLQQSARAALDMVSKDILQAGAGLPPEFPAFSRLNGAGDNVPTDVIEIIGQFQSAGSVYLDPEEIQQIDAAGNVILMSNTTNFDTVYPYNLVVVYNDAPNEDPVGPQWAMAQVTAVDETGPNAIVTLDYAPGAAYSTGVPTSAAYVRDEARGIIPKITRVSVVRYFTQTDDPALYSGQPPEVLMRFVDFGINGQQAQAVGYLDNCDPNGPDICAGGFQIAYVIGITAPVEQDNPPDPRVDLPGVPLTAENMLSSVRVTLTARSVSQNLEGSSALASGNLIRKTFSTNVNPRNISAGVDARVMAATGP